MNQRDIENIKINGKRLQLFSTTGVVADTNTRSETEVRGSGGGGQPNVHPGSSQSSPIHINIESNTTRYQDVFLVDEDNKEHVFNLVDFLVSCRKGNLLSMLWGIKPGKKQGPYLAAYNHNTQDISYNDIALEYFCRPRMLSLIVYPVMILICVILCLIVAGMIPVGDNVAVVIEPFLYLLGALIGIKAGWHISGAIMNSITQSKVNKFKNSKDWLSVIEYFQGISKDKYESVQA